MSTEQLSQDLPEQTRIRLEKVAGLRGMGVDPYTPRAHRTHEIAELAPLMPAPGAEAGGGDGGAAPPGGPGTGVDDAGEPVTIVGRLVSRRDMGRSSFGH